MKLNKYFVTKFNVMSFYVCNLATLTHEYVVQLLTKIVWNDFSGAHETEIEMCLWFMYKYLNAVDVVNYR